MTAEELCREQPDLVEPVRQGIAEQESMLSFLGNHAYDATGSSERMEDGGGISAVQNHVSTDADLSLISG